MTFNFLKFSGIGHDITKEMSNSDPFFRQFYLSYGRIFNPRNINTKEDINKELNKLVQDLHKMIEPSQGNPNFLESISDKDIQNEIEAVQNIEGGIEAIQVYNADPEKGKKFLLDLYNKDKKKVFNEWWNYITQNYKEYPAFQYIILMSVFKDLKITEKRTPQILNANAVAQTFETIKNSNDKTAINIKKTYQTKLEEVNRNELNKSEKSNGIKPGTYWIKIPSKENDSENFENNKKKLQGYASGMGWCTAGDSKADYYLTQGDLWILVVNGKIVVGMPMNGSNQISEIDGYNNQVPYDYWEEIINFVKEKNFEKNKRYFELEKNVEFNEKFEKGEIKLDIDLYRKLTKQNKSRLTEEQYAIIIKDLFIQLNNDNDFIMYFPEELIDRFGIENYIKGWENCLIGHENKIIQFPQKLIDKVGVDKYINWWENWLKITPSGITSFPKELIDRMGIEKYKILFFLAIEADASIVNLFTEDLNNKINDSNYNKAILELLDINKIINLLFDTDGLSTGAINILSKKKQLIFNNKNIIIDKLKQGIETSENIAYFEYCIRIFKNIIYVTGDNNFFNVLFRSNSIKNKIQEYAILLLSERNSSDFNFINSITGNDLFKKPKLNYVIDKIKKYDEDTLVRLILNGDIDGYEDYIANDDFKFLDEDESKEKAIKALISIEGKGEGNKNIDTIKYIHDFCGIKFNKNKFLMTIEKEAEKNIINLLNNIKNDYNNNIRSIQYLIKYFKNKFDIDLTLNLNITRSVLNIYYYYLINNLHYDMSNNILKELDNTFIIDSNKKEEFLYNMILKNTYNYINDYYFYGDVKSVIEKHPELDEKLVERLEQEIKKRSYLYSYYRKFSSRLFLKYKDRLEKLDPSKTVLAHIKLVNWYRYSKMAAT